MASAQAFSHVGKKRTTNQDSFLVREDLGLFIVADGMGGHDNGKQASRMACEIIAETYEQSSDLNVAINEAHQKIQQKSILEGLGKGMGTTVVCLEQLSNKSNIFWVGDSRAYCLKGAELKQLTNDHSFVQQLLDKKLITKEESKVHPRRNLLTQSVGLAKRSDLNIDRVTIELPKSSLVLLCTDGLTNELSDEHIQQILEQAVSDTQGVRQLVEFANDVGGNDNITAMLVRT